MATVSLFVIAHLTLVWLYGLSDTAEIEFGSDDEDHIDNDADIIEWESPGDNKDDLDYESDEEDGLFERESNHNKELA